MAALSDPTPAAPRAPRGHSAAGRIGGLIALISGFAMLIASVTAADSRSHAIEAPGTAGQRAAAARFAGSALVAEANWELPLLITSFGHPNTNYREQQARLACTARDPREALAAMAAAQYRGRSIDARSCPDGVSLAYVNLVNSDDRIANALFSASDHP